MSTINHATFTSESVCSGHPDKICDQISDAILDTAINGDPHSRVAVETAVKNNWVALLGEITTKTKFNQDIFENIVRRVIKNLGYTQNIYEFSANSVKVEVRIQKQSPDIALGVDDGGAGDQGMMFGYACNETPELMPLPITLAHRITHRLDTIRTQGELVYLRPDGKSQITVNYKNGKPQSVAKVVVAVPHDESISHDQLKNDIFRLVAKPVLQKYGFEISKNDLIVNGTGVWHIGGPASDSGVTGRKIIVDTYGGMARHGGGAFSGKDPTKVDRSASYAARWVAKNIVAAKLADKVEVRLAYVIGHQNPVDIGLETFETGILPNGDLLKRVQKVFDLRPRAIIEALDLRRPIYQQTATYGHFGRLDLDLPWEKTDRAQQLIES